MGNLLVNSESASLAIALSEIDEARFGLRVAKASHVTSEGLPGVLAFCREHDVQLLIARCGAEDVRAAQAMESAGFLLMDTLVVYTRSLAASSLPPDVGCVLVRPMRAGEEATVAAVAAEAFRDYRIGHYHADPRLDPRACDAVYTSWARVLCQERGKRSEVLVAEDGGVVIGFLGLRLSSPTEGEGVLNGVAPTAQGRGIYTSLLSEGLEWCRRHGAGCFLISTQLSNWRVQRVWARLGLRLTDASYTFHKWFE